MRRRVTTSAWVSLLAAASLVGCGEGRSLFDEARYSRADLAAALDDPSATAGYRMGEFVLRPDAVVDGDTIKVEGLDASLRLLALDTEETFKHEDELRAYEKLGFEKYLEEMSGGSGRPAKGATPLGMTAKHFAEDFFRDVTRVRLERDHPKEIRGRYNRYLTYVFADKNGQWVNYNVECVRAGMSPYFTKYGYSRRFHDEFVQAQDEARNAGRGIWEEGTEHYPDYPLRLAWWNSRADFAAQFEEQAEGREDHIVLTNWDAMDRLGEMRGEWVHVLATVGSVKPRKGRAPARVLLSRRLFQDFPLIVFDDEVLADSAAVEAEGEYVVVQGRVSRYTFKSTSKRKAPSSQLQIELKSADQIQHSRGYAGVAADFQVRPHEAPAQTVDPVEPEPPAEPEPPIDIDSGSDTDDPDTSVRDANVPLPPPPPPPPEASP